MTPDILSHNQVLLIIIACLRYFSRTEDLKRRFVSVWSCEKFCSFVFSLLSGQEKGFDKTLCISARTYGGLNHIRFAELGKEVSQSSDKIVKVQIWCRYWTLGCSNGYSREIFQYDKSQNLTSYETNDKHQMF